MARMKVAQISQPHGTWEIVEREIPKPGAGQVRIKVEACGICHSDMLVKEGLWPGIQYPRVPGHEIAGRIDAVGTGVADWRVGQRVGVGWHGGHCFHCDPCRRGDFISLRIRQNHRHYPRWRLRAIHDFSRRKRSQPARRLAADEAAPLLVRRNHRLQLPSHSGAKAEIWSPFRAWAAWDTWAFNTLAAWALPRWHLIAARTRIARGQVGSKVLYRFRLRQYAQELQKLGGVNSSWPPRPTRNPLRAGWRLGAQWEAAGGWRFCGTAVDQCARSHCRPALGSRLALRHGEGLRRHFAVQCPDRRSANDREISAGKSSGSLRTDDQRSARFRVVLTME